MTIPVRTAAAIRGVTHLICLVLLRLASSAISAPDEAQRIRNIVLVYGTWADGSGWKSVYDILMKDGYNASIVQQPKTSFKDDVAATKRISLSEWPLHPRGSQLWRSRHH